MDKAYIVINKEQELDVLKKLEQDGFNWPSGLNPTNFFPSNSHPFPIVLFERDCITWDFLSQLKNEEIVFDGRKEEKMDNKFLVTQEFMDDLVEWRDRRLIAKYVTYEDVLPSYMPSSVFEWWDEDEIPDEEHNNRLIAIIRWVNGEDVFETQKTYKYYIARTSSPVMYFSMKKWYHSEFPNYNAFLSEKNIFDTREEAEKWLIPGYEVVEIDENEL